LAFLSNHSFDLASENLFSTRDSLYWEQVYPEWKATEQLTHVLALQAKQEKNDAAARINRREVRRIPLLAMNWPALHFGFEQYLKLGSSWSDL
jgi:hypothetical protein